MPGGRSTVEPNTIRQRPCPPASPYPTLQAVPTPSLTGLPRQLADHQRLARGDGFGGALHQVVQHHVALKDGVPQPRPRRVARVLGHRPQPRLRLLCAPVGPAVGVHALDGVGQAQALC